MNETSDLPNTLLRYLADAELEVISLDVERLSIRVRKEIGPEHGLLEFIEPSIVCLQPKMGIAAIRIGSVADLPNGLLDSMRPDAKQLEGSERVYVIEGSWGERFIVIAAAVTYAIIEFQS
jgi:hypothetical protein